MADIALYTGDLNNKEKLVFDAMSKKNYLCEENRQLIASLFGQTIGLIASDMGVKTPLEPFEKARIFDFATKFYSNVNISEIKLAFELSLTGDLNRFLPKDRDGEPDKNHYQVFSLDYFAKIMNAYLKYKAELKRKAVKKQDEIFLSQEQKDILNQRIKDSLINLFNKYKKDGIKEEILIPMKYLSVIKDIEGLNDEPTAIEIKETISKILSGEVYMDESKKRFFKTEVTPEEIIKEVYSKASYIKRQNIIYDFFQILINKNRDITEVI